MNNALRLGYSPCPNDTFIFFALTQGLISTEPYEMDVVLADVEILNQEGARGSLDITKTSVHAMMHLLEDYWLLRAGGALGRGCGPLVVARHNATMRDLRDKVIAIPGKLTTANLLLQIEGTHRGRCVSMEFSHIMEAVISGQVDAGVIIHEGRFTYGSKGLKLVLDLGEWWEQETGLPLPLGCILMKRNLGHDAAQFIEDKIRESLLYSQTHPEEAWPYVRAHAQEMEIDVINQHIDMFVNDFTVNLGVEGEKAIRSLFKAACRVGGLPVPAKSIFWNEP